MKLALLTLFIPFGMVFFYLGVLADAHGVSIVAILKSVF